MAAVPVEEQAGLRTVTVQHRERFPTRETNSFSVFCVRLRVLALDEQGVALLLQFGGICGRGRRQATRTNSSQLSA